MIRRSRGLLLAFLALAALGWLRPRVQARQEAAGIVIQGAETQGMASDVAVPTLALGAFRGVIVDYLWIRTISLREQGRTYEARVLAEQIGRLQPRLPAVWDYLGSHLAYDLAATANDQESRWAWIQNGLDLVREEGLGKNPTSSRLCYTLSRIYQDKVNSTFDEHHLHFKKEHALRLSRAGIRLATIPELARAPSLGALLSQDPDAARLWAAYARARGLEASEVDPSALCASYHRFVVEGESLLEEALPGQREEVALVSALGQSPAGLRLLTTCAAASLRAIGFDPEVMRRIDAEWGPLDWQSSYSAPLYYSVQGIWFATQKGEVAQKVRCRRVALQALKNAMRFGQSQLVYDPIERRLLPLNFPNLSLIPRLEQLYAEGEAQAKAELVSMAEEGGFEAQDFRATAAFEVNQREARKDFLIEAAILFSEYGRDIEGRLLLERARALYPEEPSFEVPYRDFLLQVITQRTADAGGMDTLDSMTQALLGLWKQAFTALALGEDAKFKTYERLAIARKQRWDAYVRAALQEDPSAARRLTLDARQIQVRALMEAARALPSGFRVRLAERTGFPAERLFPKRPGAGQ